MARPWKMHTAGGCGKRCDVGVGVVWVRVHVYVSESVRLCACACHSCKSSFSRPGVQCVAGAHNLGLGLGFKVRFGFRVIGASVVLCVMR